VAPEATNNDIVVVELSTNGSASPPENVNLNIIAMGSLDVSTGVCVLASGPVALIRPVSDIAIADICVFSLSGLDPSLQFTLSGPSPADIEVVSKEPLGSAWSI
jgi:hypothetical protein